MIRTQIQLPDSVFARARKFCDEREISLAELARRGIEYMLNAYSQNSGLNDAWELPKPLDLGWTGLSHEQIKDEAQSTSAEQTNFKKRRR